MKFSKSIFKAFLDGVASIFGSFAPEPRPLYRGFEEDGEALRGDWQVIGDDMRTVMNKIEEEYNPIKECANRMKETGEGLSKVLKRYEENE